MTDITFTVEDLIPHRDRMKLVDRIDEISDDSAVTTSTVTDRWPLYRDEAVESMIAVELVAQTAAISIGAKRKRESIGGSGRGWIVGIKKAEFHVDRIPLDTRLVTTARVVLGQEAYSVIEGTVEAGPVLISTVSLQVFREEANSP